MGKTLFQKIWDAHVVRRTDGEPDLLYIDLHLLHELKTQALESLRVSGRTVRRPERTLATEDHSIPTVDTDKPIADPLTRTQVEAYRKSCAGFGIPIHPMGSPGQGIVHVISPETGLTQPGMSIVCGDSHTSTHGAFGALAFGIGNSQVEHVLATQTLPMTPFKTMAVTVEGELPASVTPKDLALSLISHVGTGGGQGHVIEYRGKAIRRLSVEGRMTVCNMSIEAGARAGLIAPDETTFSYLKDRPHSPKGQAWEQALAYWKTLVTDEDARFDREITVNVSGLTPYVTWGTNPAQGGPLADPVPDPASFSDPQQRTAAERALSYMGLAPGTDLRDVQIDTVFLGSCTNARIEDLRAAAEVLRGRTIAAGVTMLVVPGSARVAKQAEQEGLAEVFTAAGAQWRHAGCSMCPGINPDSLCPGQRCASTTNRNYEGRQGKGARTHLVSPPVAAATAVLGRLASPAGLPETSESKG